MCGEAVPKNASACPHCGADERTGWNEEATRYDGLDLPDSAFDEENVVRNSPRDRVTKTGVPYFTWAVALVMCAVVATLIIYRVF